MTIDEIAVKVSLLLQRSTDESFLSVLPLYCTEAQQIIKNAGVKDTVAESAKAVGVIARGVLDLWNFGAGEGKFSPLFFQLVEQLKYDDGTNGKLILDVEQGDGWFKFKYTDGTESEEIPCVGKPGPQGEQGPQGEKGEPGSDYVLTDNDKQEIATVVIDDLLDRFDSKQDKLVSGTNIKTVNGESLLGEGNIKTEKEYKRAYVQTTEEVKQIFLETDDFDVCFISVNTKGILCRFKPSYYYKKATSRYKIYAYSAYFSAQYGACLKIEKHPATFPYNDCSFRIYSNSIATMNPAYTTDELKNGITITTSSDADVFPVGTKLEVYYK